VICSDAVAESFPLLREQAEQVQITVSGQFVSQNGIHQLCEFGSEISELAPECVDLVIVDPDWPESDSNLVKPCVSATGVFRAYGSEFVGIGWLVSEVGLLEASRVSDCHES